MTNKESKLVNVIENNITKINNERVNQIIKLESNQNNVYKITTDENVYILKEYSKDCIKNTNDLNKIIKQIEISEQLNEQEINTILPLKNNNKYFIFNNNHYYLIYQYYNYQTLTTEDITIKHIDVIANTLAKIHHLNIQEKLDIHYSKIDIDYDKYLEYFKDNNEKIYKILKNNIEKLKLLTNNCNSNLDKINSGLCISHNDYKLKNMLWNNLELYLIDFDAVSMSNPTVSLAESAFSISIQKNNINKVFYKKFLESYIKTYGSIDIDYMLAINCAMNGKLQWLNYLLNKCIKNNQTTNKECIDMINELALYYDNIDEFYNIYLSIIQEK